MMKIHSNVGQEEAWSPATTVLLTGTTRTSPTLARPAGAAATSPRIVGSSDDVICLDVGCGTGLHFRALRQTGCSVIGCDLSADQLRIASGRHATVVRADAAELPFASSSLPLVVATFIHTDVDEWDVAVREVARVLRPGGRFVYYGLHPCYIGHFSDRQHASDEGRVVLVEGYGERDLKYEGAGANFLRPKVGGRHVPLAAFLQAFIDAGLILRRVEELHQVVVPFELSLDTEKAA